MAAYTGKPAVINRPVGDLYVHFSDLSHLKESIAAKAGADAERVGEVEVGEDFIAINNPQVGQIKFQVVERVEPERIVMKAVNSPLPIAMTINLKELAPDSTEVSTVLDIDIPPVMKAFLGPKFQKVADQFGQMMTGGTH